MKFNDPMAVEYLDGEMDKIIQTIDYAIKKSGLSEREVCKKARISHATYSNVRVTGRISLDTLILIAKALGLEIVIQEKER